jgi:hypothetical protein
MTITEEVATMQPMMAMANDDKTALNASPMVNKNKTPIIIYE